VATFTLSAAPPAEALAVLDARLGGQHPAVRRQVRAERLLADGLPLAAYREAEAVVADRPASELGWAVMLEALRRMGLADSRLADRVLDGLDAVPGPLRGRAFTPR
jgi:hypothetical protein